MLLGKQIGYWQRQSQISSLAKHQMVKLAKTFPHELLWNHAQVKDKWEKVKKIHCKEGGKSHWKHTFRVVLV